MGVAPVPILLSPNGAGNALDGSVVRNVVDDAAAGLSSKLLIYLRAGKINVANTSIIDGFGNPFSQLTGNTKNTSDSNFNNHESITLNNQVNVYQSTAGGIGIGAAPIAMTNSFSIVAGLRMTSAATSSIYGDGTSSNGGVGIYGNSSGQFIVGIDGTNEVGVNGVFPVNTTQVFWYSYDAVAKVHRYGINSGAVAGQIGGSASRTSQGTSTVCNPFGYYSSGSAGYWAYHRWMLFNKAFMNGAVAADDQQFAALIATYANYI